MLSLKAVFLCVLFLVSGPSLIFLNKYILSELKFNYPIFLSALGVTFSGLLSHVLVYFNFATLQCADQVKGRFWYTRVLPVGVAYAGTLAFGNTVYLMLDVGFIQMLKSFTPVVLMITGAIFIYRCIDNQYS
jgi:hypothetical protein